jgi:hypothetical protein
MNPQHGWFGGHQESRFPPSLAWWTLSVLERLAQGQRYVIQAYPRPTKLTTRRNTGLDLTDQYTFEPKGIAELRSA